MAAEPLQIADSTHLKGASYDEDAQELAIDFGKATYIYSNVTKDVADELAAAPSAGTFLHNVIKANPSLYPYRKA